MRIINVLFVLVRRSRRHKNMITLNIITLLSHIAHAHHTHGEHKLKENRVVNKNSRITRGLFFYSVWVKYLNIRVSLRTCTQVRCSCGSWYQVYDIGKSHKNGLISSTFFLPLFTILSACLEQHAKKCHISNNLQRK